MDLKPYLFDFDKIGSEEIGFISVFEYHQAIPFEIKRAYCTLDTPDEILRGRHAHYKTKQVLIALKGEIVVTIEGKEDDPQVFKLNSPNIGLYIPPLYWHTMQYRDNALQLVFASEEFAESDYIRSYTTFKSL